MIPMLNISELEDTIEKDEESTDLASLQKKTYKEALVG